MGLDREKIIRTWRLALTCIFLFTLTWYYKIPEPGWSLITIWFVMYDYSTVGGVLNKSMLRFIGTGLSALYGIVIVYCCGNDPVINILALVAGLFLYNYWFMNGEKAYIGTIGCVTLTIALLNYNDVDAAILRIFNVILGILTSVFMICFFYPQYARKSVMEQQALWLDGLLEVLHSCLNPQEDYSAVKSKADALDNQMIISRANYNKLLGEAKIETKAAPAFVVYSAAIQEQCQRLARLFNLFVAVWFSTQRHSSVKPVLHTMVLELEYLKQCLGGGDLIPWQCSLVDNPLSDKPIDTLLREMSDAINRLQQDITHNVASYEYYADLPMDKLKANP